MSQLDVLLQNINKFITISDTDRAPYAADFDYIRDTIINKMRKLEPVFGKIFNGPCLGGSYADNLKISEPNEYDLVLKIKLRETQLITVTKDPNLAGYCNINIKDSQKKIKPEKQNKDIYELFESFVTEDGYLIQDKFQSWMESLMTKIIRYELNNGEIGNNGKKYKLRYTKAGPAHTITVQRDDNKFSIDFVPAFIFDKTKWIATRELPPNTPPTCQDWLAVPKPVKNTSSPNLSFITSYVDSERHLIANKNNLKNTLKMLKKIRDRRKLNNLKSYYIKTVYLWEDEEQLKSSSDFWSSSTSKVLLHMINKLIGHLVKGKICFFWDQSQNLLGNLTKNQIDNILKEFQNAVTILTMSFNLDKVLDLFLTGEEKSRLLQLSRPTYDPPIIPLDNIDGIKLVQISKDGKSSEPERNKINVLSESEKKVIQIKNILKKYENDSERILTEIKKIVNDQNVSDVNSLTPMFSFLDVSSSSKNNFSNT